VPKTGANLRLLLAIPTLGFLAAGCLASWWFQRPDWATPAFAAAIVIGAVFPAKRAVISLRKGTFDINALMVVAVIGAMAIGQWEEGATVVLLFAVAQWLETQSLDRARAAIRKLMDLTPPEVSIRDGAGERRVGVDAVTLPALMLVRPGEKIALDGVIEEGRSDINQAPITGESLPVDKGPGDEVYAGTINGHGALSIVVTRRRQETTLARIIHLVETAQAERAPVQLFIDRFAAWYTPGVLALAVLIATVPPLFGGVFDVWLYRALVLLVVACPCALVISTPVSIVSALAGAARQGVLIKGGVHLERLAGIRAIAFDKTGTLTHGDIRVAQVDAMAGHDRDEVLSVAAAVERRSEHPIARAIVAAAEADSLAVYPATGVRALPGLGVVGTVDGREIACGHAGFFAERGALTADARTGAAAMISHGLAPVLVADNDRIIGVIGVSDRERATATTVVEGLRGEGVGRIAMLTGDHEAAAQAIGRRLGVDDVRAGLLPAGKLSALRALRDEAGAVAMVGDGVNDAPALAASDVGIVMGAMGSDAAIETADVALMTDDLRKIPYVLRLSRATLANIRANVAIALALKGAFVVMALAGIATLWMAVLADTGASVIVVANALRLRRFR
jgi:Cd2+/Zn2+-exporting ATPase